MLKYFLVLFGIGLCAGTAGAQVWKEVNNAAPSGPLVFATNDSGYCFDGLHLFASSDSGKNFRSSNVSGGATTILNDMSWPTSRCGYMAYNVNSATRLVRTNDAGQSLTTWNVPSNLTFYHFSFPTPAIGYATGDFNPSTQGYFVAKSTDSGESWNVVASNTLRFGEIVFKNATNGIFVVYEASGVPQVEYTFDGLKNVNLSIAAIPFRDNQETGFLDWNDDGSWIVQNQGIWRSSDSGKSWNVVLPDADPDNSYGAIETVCFSGPRGFAFADNSNVFETTDFGADWQGPTSISSGTTGAGSFSSMPSPTVAYVTGTSADGSSNVLLKIGLPALPPPEGVTETFAQPSEDFRVVASGTGLFFTASSSAEPRSIEILDVLGRKCASLPLAAMSARAELAPSTLRPGSYFARLGGEIVKFCVLQ